MALLAELDIRQRRVLLASTERRARVLTGQETLRALALPNMAGGFPFGRAAHRLGVRA